MVAEFSMPEEDMVALPEARIVKFQYLFDYYDAKEFIVKYLNTGSKKSLLKATNSLLGLWLQLKCEFRAKDRQTKEYKELEKIEFFLRDRSKIPTYMLLLAFWFGLQKKLKDMKVLDITFPEADIGKDFQRSF